MRSLPLLTLACIAWGLPATMAQDSGAALLELKASLSDPRDPAWAGVACSAGGQVVGLSLVGLGLGGTLAASLGRLAALQELRLSGNALTGSLPPEWGRLGSLQKLQLDANVLTGSLPPSWASLQALKHMNLASNNLTGPLPLAWGQLRGAYLINLAGNRLTGTLPSTWGAQGLLMHLRLAGNLLEGPLPFEWGRLRRILTLDVSGNRLTGTLPSTYGALTQATLMDLSGNLLEGPLPPAWAQLASLQIMALQNNALSGVVPAEWNALSARLYSLQLSNNLALCGDLPDALAAAAGQAQRRGTGLGRPCPWAADAEALMQFRQSLADPQGVLASWRWDSNPCGVGGWRGVACRAGRVVGLNLTAAHLSGGPSSAALAALDALEVLDLSQNMFPAPLPAALGQLRRLRVLDLSRTEASGPLPQDWAALASLASLHLMDNELTGTLPASWGTGLRSLEALDLSHNGLEGSLPPQWAGLAALASLRLDNNELEGPVPPGWGRLAALTRVDLSNNLGICGGTPAWPRAAAVLTANTNLHQSCLLVQSSGLVFGVVLVVAAVASLASIVSITALVVYLGATKSSLREALQERSCASLGSFLSAHTSVAAGHALHSTLRAKAAMNSFSQGGGLPRVKVPSKAPLSPEPKSPGIAARAWQLAAYAHEHGQDLVGRRGYRRLFRTQSADSTLCAGGGGAPGSPGSAPARSQPSGAAQSLELV